MIDREAKGETSRGGRKTELGSTDAIASQLKQFYTSVEEEPIPDHLLGLLEKLDEAERSGGSNGAN
ncbi:NepR family anti-sigma factor [uncultured Hoeflea sp.]|uniref:NepR family anti-sigma factor n=1 Tax=uncultured Hoeflea sp. TaxID=538666 RepID=UPI0030EEDC84|tara:strand:- start:1902 stop:2099 length:198 start_codon:yes stop_codon:yes gene_type:complete